MSSSSVELGSVIYSAVKPIFKIYFIIAIGFWLARRNILNVGTCRDISDTIVTVILPCLIFENVVSNLRSSDIKNLGIIFFTSTLLFGVGGLLTFVLSIVTRSPKRWFGGLLSVGLFPNISDLPIAYVQTLSNGGMVFTKAEGDKGVAYICIFLAAQAAFQFSCGLYRLIEWDFREELLHEEDKLESSGSEGSNTEKVSQNGEHRSGNVVSTSNSSAVSNTSVSPSQVVPTSLAAESVSHNDRDSYDEALSISSSISEQRELPPPTDLGSLRANSRTTEPITITQTRSRRASRRRDSITSVGSPNLLQPSKSRDLRSMRSEDIHDVINEYSEYDTLRDNYVERVPTGGGDIAMSVMSHTKSNQTEKRSFSASVISKLKFVLKNLSSPVSVTLIVSLAIAMAPPLKALFVHSTFDIPDAPDGLPPLSFIMDISSYVGAASVPLGLLLLGATIARLEVGTMPPGFWKTALGTVCIRLVILPIFGVGLTTGLQKGGWYGTDKLIRFISVLEFGLPNATSLVYFTAFYTSPTAKDHIQMDCLASCLIFQYAVLCISLPILVSFTIKVSLGY